MKLLCIGDSNTYGYNPHSQFGGRYPAEIRWTNRLNHCRVTNCGMNGMTVPREAKDFSALIESEAPDLVTVMLGSNDLLQGASAEKTAFRMESFLSCICQMEAVFLLIAPPPMQLGDWVESETLVDQSRKLGNLYRGISERMKIHFADAGDWKIELTYDGVHFSPEGHAAFARSLEQVINELFP